MGSKTIFISYAREDIEAARRLYKELKSFGLDPWLDEESLLPGQKWKIEIHKAIIKSKYFIALLSTRSVPKRGYVQKELREALDVIDEIPDTDIYVIPIRLDDCDPSYEKLIDIHRVDMFPSWNDGLNKALRAMGVERVGEYIEKKPDKEIFRVATFNMMNFNDDASLLERVALLKPQLFRISADILCLQEIDAQEGSEPSRYLSALEKLIEGTPYADYQILSTKTSSDDPYYQRNLVILSRFEIIESRQIRHDYITSPSYRQSFSIDVENNTKNIVWERPILYAKVKLGQDNFIHVINVHLKSRIPSRILGQKDSHIWETMTGLAEGRFLSLVKQAGQALETRALVDELFDAYEQPKIVVCGDFNADLEDPPLQTIMGDPPMVNDENSQRNLILAQSGISDYSRYSLMHRGKGIMIDHVLMSLPMLEKYRYSEVHNEMLPDHTNNWSEHLQSDHAPVIAEFYLN